MSIKKVILVVLLIILLWFGTYFSIDYFSSQDQNPPSTSINTNIPKTTARESFIAQNSWQYHEAKTTVTISTWRVVAWINADPNAPYVWVTVTENWETYKVADITWYLYSYIYDDLGIKITTPTNYEPYFSNKTNNPILKRIDNILYPASAELWNGSILEYLAIFSKDKKTSLEQEVMNKHIPSWCTLITGSIPNDETTPPFASMQWWEIIHIASQDWNLASNWDIFDKEFPENMLSISFVMNPKKPNRYYKISHGDCAPGPCTIFGNIEFF